ncbi:MAG: replication initiation protein [Staphylococcus equorum]|nr:replication initiation protein [Tetragenococcus koreensis]MDN6294671.1 replication initiation protein [Alkalibacterium sp.]MDN6409719.1 replication initiation protein [Tetragenococcus halophilus]MDN6640962.1 replication initiation protein [Tetragenococcus sp.]MDN6722353.1 replication initiation protein [Staphylococcus equorum]
MNEVVRYDNGLNTVALRSFTPVEMNLFWSVCAKMKRRGTQTVEFDFEVFKKLSQYDRREKDRFYNDLKSMFEKMNRLNFYFENESYYEQLMLFQRFAIDKDREKVIVQASEKFEFILNSIGTNFTRFELENLTVLNSSYVKELYRQLMQFRDIKTRSGYWAVTVEDFRKLLDIPDSYRMSHIDSRIFKKAEEEFLNSRDNRLPIFSKFTIEKIKAKKGNKIQRFVIRFTEYLDPNPVPMVNWLEDDNSN